MKKVIKYHSSLLLAAALALMGVLSYPQKAYALFGFLKTIADTALIEVIGGIVYAFSWIIGQLIAFTLIPILVMIASYNDFTSEWGVEMGWTIVRDISNMLFIIVLLVIAVATIFKVESYSYRALLPKLVIMAVLINFSKMITGFFIDLSQIIMLTFVNSFRDIAGGNIIYATGVGQILSFQSIGDRLKGEGAPVLQLIGALLLGLAVVAITAGVLLAFIVVMTFRLVMLWTLTVLSPLAYILSVFPGGQKYASQWWEKFTSNLIVGPVLAFFLWLSFAIMQNNLFTQRENSTFQRYLSEEKLQIEKYNPFFTEVGGLDTMINFIIVISLLVGSLTLTQQLGVMGGQFAGTVSGKLQQWGAAPFKGIAKGALYPVKSIITTGVDELYQKRGIDLNIPRFLKSFREAKEARRQEKALKGTLVASEKIGEVSGPFRRLKTAMYASGVGGYTGDELTTWNGLKRFFKGNVGVKADQAAQDKLAERQKETERQMRIRGMMVGLGDETKKKRNVFLEDGQTHLEELKGKATQAELKLKKGERDIEAAERQAKKEENEEDRDRIIRAKLGDIIDTEGLEVDAKSFDGRPVGILKQAVVKALTQGFDEARTTRDHVADALKEMASAIGILDRVSEGKITDPNEARSAEEKFLNAQYQLTHGVDEKQYEDLRKAKDYVQLAKNDKERDEALTQARKTGLIGITEGEKELKARMDEVGRIIIDARKERDKELKAVKDVHDIEGFKWEGIEKRKVEARQADINAELAQIERGKKGSINGLTNTEKSGRDERMKELERLLKLIDNDIRNTKDAEQLKILKADQKNKDEELKTLTGLAGAASEAQLGNEDRKREVDEYVEKLKGEFETNVGKIAVPHATDAQKAAFHEEIENIEVKAKALQSEAARLRMPTNFEAATARRALDSHELQKMGDVKNYQELNAYLEDAIHEKRWGRVGAIMRSLARDYNDNEAFNYFNYASDFSGMRKFTKEQLIETAKMPKQAAYALMNDIAHINEQVNHWETGRVMDVKNGEFVWKTEAGHAMESLAEIRKQGARYGLQKINRLGYGGERQYADGHRDFFIKPLGLGIMQTFGSDIAQMMMERGTELNKNAMEKIFLTPDVAKVIRGMPKIWDSFYIDRMLKKQKFSTASGNYVQGLGRLEDYKLQAVVEQGMHHFLNQGIWQQYMADALKKTGR